MRHHPLLQQVQHNLEGCHGGGRLSALEGHPLVLDLGHRLAVDVEGIARADENGVARAWARVTEPIRLVAAGNGNNDAVALMEGCGEASVWVDDALVDEGVARRALNLVLEWVMLVSEVPGPHQDTDTT